MLSGLSRPVIRNAEFMSYGQIEGWLAHFRAQGGTPESDDKGGTFGIITGGHNTTFMGTGHLKPNESAVLSIHKMVKKPLVVKNQIEIRPMSCATLTYDHRLIRQRDASVFLRRIKSAMETPMMILTAL